MNGKNNFLFLFICLVFISIPPVLSAQEYTSSEKFVSVGNTFTLTRPIETTFHRWTVEDYDPKHAALNNEIKPDTLESYRFQFEALETGESEITFAKILSTQLGEEYVRYHTVNLRVLGEQETPPSETAGTIPKTKDNFSSDQTKNFQPGRGSLPDRDEKSTDVDEAAWERVNELLDIGRYDQARKIIQDQSNQTGGNTLRKWRKKLAESHMSQSNYTEAINVWEGLIDNFPNGPVSQWLLRIARAHRKNDNDEEAELVLLKIRHQHSDSKQWPEAMEMLADIAINDDEINRAKNILQKARAFYKGREKPKLIFRLARLYDKYPPLRNYRRAVRLYRRAATGLASSDPETAEEARKRANHLMKNYVNFGTE